MSGGDYRHGCMSAVLKHHKHLKSYNVKTNNKVISEDLRDIICCVSRGAVWIPNFFLISSRELLQFIEAAVKHSEKQAVRLENNDIFYFVSCMCLSAYCM